MKKIGVFRYLWLNFLLIVSMLFIHTKSSALNTAVPQLPVTFYLPFGPDARSPGYAGVWVSNSGLLYEQDYLNAGISTVETEDNCSTVAINVFCDGKGHWGQYHAARPNLPEEQRGPIDFVLPYGTPVLASADGIVRSTNSCEVFITHADGTVTGYLHLSQVTVRSGNPISRGDIIGLSGDKGPFSVQQGQTPCKAGAVGSHLHFVLLSSNMNTEQKVYFADSSVQPHGGIVRPSVFRGNSTLRFFYQADGVVPADNADPTSDLVFSDVPTTHAFWKYIMALYFQGAINGYSDGTFRPDDFLTRGAAAKIIIIAAGEEQEYSDGQCAFDDVCPSHTFYSYIRRLSDLEWTGGCGNGDYCPDDFLTRGAMTKFVVLAHDRVEPSYGTCVQPFPDVSCSHTFYRYIRRLKEIFDAKGVSLGYSDGTFHPDENITRGGSTKFTVVGLDLEYWIPPFTDVLPDNLFYEYIKAMKERGITDGYSDGTYRPDTLLQRGQAAKFITRALGADPNYQDGRQSFPDVPSSHTFYQYVEYLYEIGAVSGYSDGLFHPDDNITRGQVAKIIVLALESRGVYCEYNQPQAFNDVPPSHIFYNHIQCLKELNITDGYSDGTFRPDVEITRGQVAKFIYRAFIATIPNIPQEETETINDDPGTAPIQEEYDPSDEYEDEGTGGEIPRYTIPEGDEDFFRFNPQPGQMYQIATNGAGLHLDLRIEVFASIEDINANRPIETFTGQSGQESFAIWEAENANTHYVRMTNEASFATEGDGGNVRIEPIEVTIYKTFLPTMLNNASITPAPPENKLTGTLTENGVPVSGMLLELRYFNGSWSTYATTTTNTSGYYQFSSLPSLTGNQTYYVRWVNGNANSSQLAFWGCDAITAFTNDTSAFQCSFDIDNVEMSTPAPGTTVPLPYTFYWNRRAFTSDSYEYDLEDPSDSDPWWWTDPLGYVDHYLLFELPDGFVTNQQYGWSIWVHGVNGVGASYYIRYVTFSTSGIMVASIQDIPRNTQKHLNDMFEAEVLEPHSITK